MPVSAITLNSVDNHYREINKPKLLKMINKKEVKRIIQEKLKDNPNYLNEQAEAYDTEFALQKTLMIEFFPQEKIDDVEELRDYLFELKEELSNE